MYRTQKHRDDRADYFLFEIVDRVTGEPVPRGEQGQITATTLAKEAMPLLRSGTQDASGLNAEPEVRDEDIERTLEDNIKTQIGVTVGVELVDSQGLPTSEKKTRRVFDNRALWAVTLPALAR